MDIAAIMCFVVSILLIIGLIVYLIRLIIQRMRYKKSLEAAYHAYQEALLRLRQNPANAEAQTHALHAGRVYAAWTRNGRGITVFDEVALMNDINAATAGARQN